LIIALVCARMCHLGTIAGSGGDAVPARSGWDLTPRQSVELECQRRGRGLVVDGCVALLRRQDVDDNLIMALGGLGARIVLDDGPKQRNQYWRRVWGARGLLYAFDEPATEAIIEALGDEHWRVREMAAKVIARHKIGAALSAVADVRDDAVPRVRSAAARAVVVLTAAGS
jgi:HEAT repeats